MRLRKDRSMMTQKNITDTKLSFYPHKQDILLMVLQVMIAKHQGLDNFHVI